MKTIVLALAVLLLVTVHVEAGHKRRKGPSAREKVAMRRLQNVKADKLGLRKIKSRKELKQIAADSMLARKRGIVKIQPIRGKLKIKGSVPEWRRLLTRPAAQAAGHFSRLCGRPGRELTITSAARDPETQSGIRHNAASAKGPLASLHMRFVAFDVTRRGLTDSQQECILE